MAPPLSVVVVAHDMAREIRRTIRSLSPLMQRDIAADAYEIIIVDTSGRHAQEAALFEEMEQAALYT